MSRHDDVDIPSLTLDQDEVSERRSIQPTKKRKLNPPPAHPVKNTQATATPVYKKPSLAGVYFLLFLILGAAGGAGYWLWMQNQMLLAELQDAKGEIRNLDHQLIAADVSANEQDISIEQTLKNHDSEIRKLWGVSYDRNRGAIKANTDSLTDLDKKLSSVRESVSTQAKLVAVQGDAFSDLEDGYNKLLSTVAALETGDQEKTVDIASMKERLDGASDTLLELNTRTAGTFGQIEAQKLQMDQLLKQVEQQKSELNQSAGRVSELAKQNSELEKALAELRRLVESAPAPQVVNTAVSVPDEVNQALSKHQQSIDSHDEAIRSNDAFRQQMITRLNTLEAQVRQLSIQQQLIAE